MNNTISKDETLSKLMVGVNTLVDVVKTTAGAKGHTILIEKMGNEPYITKDGVTVAKHIQCRDAIENLGCKLVHETAELTVNDAGDGTTATCIVAQHLMNMFIKSDENHRDLFKKVEDETEKILEWLREDVNDITKIEECIEVATIATNDEWIGELVGKVMWDAKENGVVMFELSENGETYVYQESGSRYEKRYGLKSFLGATGTKVSYNNPIVVNMSEDVVHIDKLLPYLDASKAEDRALVIVAPNYSKMVLSILEFNSIKNGYKILPLYNPGYGDDAIELCKDIDALIDGDNVDKVVATQKDFTIFIKKRTESLQKRIDVLAHQITVEKSPYYSDKIEKRMSILSQKVFTIYAGATSTLEQNELRDRMEDGLLATRAAIDNGYVLGGGLALRNIANEHGDELPILKDTIMQPYLQILDNANMLSIANDSFSSTHGLDVKNMERVDFFEAGIIDSYSVVEATLKNAVSVAKTIISLNGAIAHKDYGYKKVHISELQGPEQVDGLIGGTQ